MRARGTVEKKGAPEWKWGGIFMGGTPGPVCQDLASTAWSWTTWCCSSLMMVWI